MTGPRSYELTYTGDIAAGSVSVAGRRVSFTRGVPVAFTATETLDLNHEWIGERFHPGLGTSPVAIEVPDGETATLIEDEAGGLAVVDGRRFGTVAEVIAAATTPERARLLLDHELALAKPRSTLVAQLEQLAADANPAGTAGHAEEA